MDASEESEMMRQHLSDSTVILHKWTEIEETDTAHMYCNVGKYSNLKFNVNYYKSVTDKWYFKLRRTKNDVYLQIHSSVSYKYVEIAIIFEENLETEAIATEVKPNVYQAEFPTERVEGCENLFLKKYGILRIRCQSEAEPLKKFPTTSIDSCRTVNDARRFYGNMRHVYSTLQFCDFKFVATMNQREIFPLHKSLLAARSSFFKAMFESDPRSQDYFELHTYSTTVQILTQYLYTGHLPKLSFYVAAEVLKISEIFGFECLHKKCMSGVREDFDEDELLQLLKWHSYGLVWDC